MTCRNCLADAYVYRLGGDCDSCTVRWLTRMPHDVRTEALKRQSQEIRAKVAAALQKAAR